MTREKLQKGPHVILQSIGRGIRLSSFVSVVALALGATACATEVGTDDAEDGVSTEAELAATQEQRAQLALDATPVRTWNETAIGACYVADPSVSGFYCFHTLSMVHIAMHDALNAIVPKYEIHTYGGPRATASPVAALATAAHDVLASIYPAQTATFDAQLATSLAGIPSGALRTRGEALGRAVASAVVAARVNDGIDLGGTYTPKTTPGSYQFTPPFDAPPYGPVAAWPDLGDAKPFGLKKSDQFVSAPPPALTSAKYTASFNEAKAIGSAASTTRTYAQAEYAIWWYEQAFLTWNRIAKTTTTDRRLGLWDTARAYALVNVVLYDAHVATQKLKYDYFERWRPITAIRAAATDGNAATAPDAAWEPLLMTPPTPEYPSTHAAAGEAAARALAAVFGTDAVPFSATSTTYIPGSETRSFAKLSDAAAECADSRVMVGIHFRYSTDEGRSLGKKIATYTLGARFRPRF